MKTKDNYNFSEWFVKRNLKELGYQSEKMQTVINSLATQELPTVFAACPSAGKTLMSICMIDTILKDNPNFRVLVLAHGTNVLRSQYYEEIVSANPSFTHCEITSKKEMDDCDGQVVVTIPQSIKGVKKLPKFDMVVVDEAHQFYFAEMVQTIIRNVGAKHQLMLTGTPSIFIFNEFPLITVTVNEILEYDMVEDLTVVVASSNYRINREDFNASGEVREEFFDNQEEQTNNTLDDFLGVLESKLKSVLKEFTAIEAGVSALTGWHLPLKALDKTMIVARSQQQGMQIRNYFLRKKVNVALSTSDTDSTSSEIQRFKQDDDCRILIVVGRGILGFSFPRMINVVDMSGTQNIDRIFQLMCRVIRKHPNNRKKFFFKIAPKDFEHNYEYIMTATMCLCDESYYTKYNGENFLDLEIPVVRTPRPPREPREDDEDEPGEPRQRREAGIRPVEFLGLPEGIRFFKDLLHKDNGEAMVNHSYAKIREVKYLLGEYQVLPMGYWTLEKCMEESAKYNTVTEWVKNNGSSYSIASRDGFLDQCTKHMTSTQKPTGYWTKERCIEDSSKYNTISEWKKNSSSALTRASKNGWLDECTTHMKKVTPQWTKENCLEQALKYKTPIEWRKNSGGSYTAAQKNKWYGECTSHMTNSRKPNGHWNIKENCIEEVKKYSGVKEWVKKSCGSYESALKNGWLEECKQYLNNK
jgi:superfamily II DNA or RNA helicase